MFNNIELISPIKVFNDHFFQNETQTKLAKKILNYFSFHNFHRLDHSFKLTQVFPFHKLDPEILTIIFTKLDHASLVNASLVNKQWHSVANDDLVLKNLRPQKIFGRKEWLEFLDVDIGEEPSLPKNIINILNEICPLFPERKTVGEVYDLMLIPDSLNGKPLKAKIIKKIFSKKFPNFLMSDFRFKKLNRSSYWILIMKNCYNLNDAGIRNSIEIINNQGQLNNENHICRLPKVAEFITYIFLKYAQINRNDFKQSLCLENEVYNGYVDEVCPGFIFQSHYICQKSKSNSFLFAFMVRDLIE